MDGLSNLRLFIFFSYSFILLIQVEFLFFVIAVIIFYSYVTVVDFYVVFSGLSIVVVLGPVFWVLSFVLLR